MTRSTTIHPSILTKTPSLLYLYQHHNHPTLPKKGPTQNPTPHPTGPASVSSCPRPAERLSSRRQTNDEKKKSEGWKAQEMWPRGPDEQRSRRALHVPPRRSFIYGVSLHRRKEGMDRRKRRYEYKHTHKHNYHSGTGILSYE